VVGGSNGAISGLTKFNRYVGENNAQEVIRLVAIESISGDKYTWMLQHSLKYSRKQEHRVHPAHYDRLFQQ